MSDQASPKLFSYQHRHSDYDPSYYRLYSPSGLSLCLVNCDKDTEAFIAEANTAITEADELREKVQQAEKFAKEFLETMNRFGDWDDGCFYYNKRSAPELQPLQRQAESFVQKMDD